MAGGGCPSVRGPSLAARRDKPRQHPFPLHRSFLPSRSQLCVRVCVGVCRPAAQLAFPWLACLHKRAVRAVPVLQCAGQGCRARRDAGEGCDTKSFGGLCVCHGACGRRSAGLSSWARIFVCALLFIRSRLHVGDMRNALNAACLCIMLLLLVHCRYIVILLCCYIALIDCLEILMRKDTGFHFKSCC